MAGFDHTSGKYLETGGAKIYYEIQGNPAGPVLLVLHGGFGTMDDFNGMIGSLAHKYKIIGVDSRGQGRSTLGPLELTYAQIQQDVMNILNFLNINSLSIIGFSDGGIVAYRLAVLSKLKIEKLVTISSRWNISDALLTENMFLKITPESYRNQFPEVYEAYQRLNPEPDFGKLTGGLVKMWLDPNPTAYLNEDIKGIDCPLLIVHGDDDQILTRKSVTALSDIVKGAHLLNIPFAKHPAFKEQPEIFRISLEQFLEKY